MKRRMRTHLKLILGTCLLAPVALSQVVAPVVPGVAPAVAGKASESEAPSLSRFKSDNASVTIHFKNGTKFGVTFILHLSNLSNLQREWKAGKEGKEIYTYSSSSGDGTVAVAFSEIVAITTASLKPPVKE